MIGGLSKSTSRLALIAAAGLMVGGIAMPSAKAADLGGDCCADLEERVAELEATTARKGNRRVSLTITGQVNRMIMWYSDGHMSNTYYGLDNTATSSRFALLGNARISPKMLAGFEMLLEIEAGGTSSKVNQLDEDGKLSHALPVGNNISYNSAAASDPFLDIRRMAVWMEHSDLGRLTLGRFEGAGTPYTIDLGGISSATSIGSKSIISGGILLRDASGQLYNIPVGTFQDPVGTQSGSFGRQELIRYDSPTFLTDIFGTKGGFIATGSIGEAGDHWGVQLRYAGETCCGVRIAAQIGYDRSRDRLTTGLAPAGNQLYQLNQFSPFLNGMFTPDIQSWGAALSLMHVPTGLFVQGHWQKQDFGSPHFSNGYYGSAGSLLTPDATTKKDAADWMIQSGIAKNFFGIGNTALYSEYGRSYDYGASASGRNFGGATTCTAFVNAAGAAAVAGQTCSEGFTALTLVTDTLATVWGVGVVQKIDAAAMDLYLGYRNHDTRVVTTTVAGNPTTTRTLQFEDIHVVVGGALIRF